MNCFKIIPAVTPIQFSDPKDIHLVVARVESLTAAFLLAFFVFIHLPIFTYLPHLHTSVSHLYIH